MKLTDVAIRSLPLPQKGQVTYFDDGLKGFGVRVSKAGSRSFVLLVGANRKRTTIGRYPVVGLAQARDIARKQLAEWILGKRDTPPTSPPATSLPATPPPTTLRELVEHFMGEKKLTLRPRTIGDYQRLLDKHFSFDAEVTAITPQRLATVFNAVRAPQERAHLINLARMLFRFAELRNDTPRSPALGFIVQAPKARERVLSSDELRAIWRACADDPFGISVKHMMLTGQRRGEIQHITLNGDIATIPSHHTKNKRTHVFPVGGTAQGLLQKPREFNGWGNAKARLDKASGVADWTLHDLRRTYATTLTELGTPPHVIEAILNHKSGIIAGVAQTYNRFRYVEEMRVVIQCFERHFVSILVE